MSGCAVSLAASERIHSISDQFLHDVSFHFERYGIDKDPKARGVSLEADECIETLKGRLKRQEIQIDYLSEVSFEIGDWEGRCGGSLKGDDDAWGDFCHLYVHVRSFSMSVTTLFLAFSALFDFFFSACLGIS